MEGLMGREKVRRYGFHQGWGGAKDPFTFLVGAVLLAIQSIRDILIMH
jgi:hypothetical protein